MNLERKMISEVNTIRFVQVENMILNLQDVVSVEWQTSDSIQINFVGNQSKTINGDKASDLRAFFELASVKL